MIRAKSLNISEILSGNRTLVKNAMLTIGGSLIIATLAQLRLNLPFSPVPVTGQTLGVLLVGILLGANRGSMAVMMYLTEGVCGLPVFAGGGFGTAYLLGPTGGYLVGFVGTAYLAGYLMQMHWDRNLALLTVGIIVSLAITFVVGTLWLSLFVGLSTAVKLGLMPFMTGEVLKIAVVIVSLPAGKKMLNHWQNS